MKSVTLIRRIIRRWHRGFRPHIRSHSPVAWPAPFLLNVSSVDMDERTPFSGLLTHSLKMKTSTVSCRTVCSAGAVSFTGTPTDELLLKWQQHAGSFPVTWPLLVAMN